MRMSLEDIFLSLTTEEPAEDRGGAPPADERADAGSPPSSEPGAESEATNA
jgi:hypothetical protein